MRSVPTDAEAPMAHALTLLCGPLATFALAALCAGLLTRFRNNVPLLVFGLWNAVFRFAVLMDGKGADEAKVSALLGTPYVFQGLSVVASAALSVWVLRTQRRFRLAIWQIPLAFVLFAPCYIWSLRAMAWVAS